MSTTPPTPAFPATPTGIPATPSSTNSRKHTNSGGQTSPGSEGSQANLGSQATPHSRENSARHILAVFRLHFANPTNIIWMPLAVYGVIFAINWIIWLILNLNIADTATIDQSTSWSGGSAFIFVWFLVVGLQAMNRTFHFALGLGATRRDYYLGTTVALVTSCAGWAILFGTLALIEEASNGWGLHGHMFTSTYFGQGNPLARFWYTFLLMLFFAGLGLLAGAFFVRWHTWGLITVGTVFALILIGAGAWITLTNSWSQLEQFFVNAGFAGAYPLLLIPTVVAGVLGYLALRRAPARA